MRKRICTWLSMIGVSHFRILRRSGNSYNEVSSFQDSHSEASNDYGAGYESLVRISSYPGYYDDSVRTIVYNNEVEEEQPSVFDYCPRKPVAITSNHQPELSLPSSKISWASNEVSEINTKKLTAQIVTLLVIVWMLALLEV